ncbi:nucleoside phosphorylase [Spongiivirga sp. MCCC 1A20706]|uniref:nucleoside phosphorylase n=1 Tax=Spongiivirga sp. MCCC 1A20706 TaxID=3160963 RepID=UPI0039774435
MRIEESELIINDDGSIYHLNLKPGEIADIVITVGDPNRVDRVTQYFDEIEFTREKREFKTTTGSLNGKRISVISTGIGTDNIDIVLNELDALVNIDFDGRIIKPNKTSLNIIRIGTCGGIQEDIDVGDFVVSKYGIGFDGLLHFYEDDKSETTLASALQTHLNWPDNMTKPYVYKADEHLIKCLSSGSTFSGMTATNCGFYGPQGRKLRLNAADQKMNDKLLTFSYEGNRITNLEMETAGIYGLSALLGHKALSMNVILANRANGTFSKEPKTDVKKLIEYTLEKITSSNL